MHYHKTYLSFRKTRAWVLPCHHYLFRLLLGSFTGGTRLGPTEGSMEKPSISLLNSSGVMLLASCTVPGHWKHPSASLMYRRMNLSPVHKIPLIRSRLVPQNRNKVSFSNGSSPYFNLTMAASPSIPFRRSHLPVYPNMRVSRLILRIFLSSSFLGDIGIVGFLK